VQAHPRAPVVRVSWFAARAYCAWRGGRLPREAEWELVAAASERLRDGREDAEFQAQVLTALTRKVPVRMPPVAQGKPNAWGVHDLHGLIWEWVEDFGAALVAIDDRGKGEADRSRFCGASGALSRDPRDYAAFMRLAFRSSLIGRDTTGGLGFRCAYDEVTP
jgi:sulfatase modifying factor 1